MNPEPLVIGIGEFLWDMLPAGRKAGGAPVNFAYHASQNGVEGWAVSAVGDDAAGRDLLAVTDSYGIRTLVATVDRPTGTVDVALCGGQPSYTIHENVAWDYIPLTEEMISLARRAGAVCFGTLAQRGEVSRLTTRALVGAVPHEAYRVYDINLRQHFYSEELIDGSLRMANVLKINDDELVVLQRMFSLPEDASGACRALSERYGLRMVVLTAGERFSSVYTCGGVSTLPTPRVNVVDTVGAGDAFTGALVGSLLSGKTVEEAHWTAVESAAYVCTCAGAWPPPRK